MRWIAVALTAGILQLQTPAFEVVSVKPSAPETPRGGGFGMSPSGLFQVQGLTLVELKPAPD